MQSKVLLAAIHSGVQPAVPDLCSRLLTRQESLVSAASTAKVSDFVQTQFETFLTLKLAWDFGLKL